MYDFGTHFEVDLTKSKTPSSNVFRGKTYRISILSDVLIRFEYSETGSFNDYPTFFASNRSFGKPKITVEEDNNVLIIKNNIFVLEYTKEKPFIGSKLLPDQYLRVTIVGTEKTWYFCHDLYYNKGLKRDSELEILSQKKNFDIIVKKKDNFFGKNLEFEKTLGIIMIYLKRWKERYLWARLKKCLETGQLRKSWCVYSS